MSDENARDHTYLGTRLTPTEYYKRLAHRYHNPHAEGIAELLERLAPHLHGHILDLGCGDGLATKLLSGSPSTFVGADAAPAMVARYRRETGYPAEVAGFVDRLPPADSVVAIYALHLAEPRDVPMLWWRLWETGADRLVVITPFKERPEAPAHYFTELERISGPYGPAGKTIHGRAYARVAEAAAP